MTDSSFHTDKNAIIKIMPLIEVEEIVKIYGEGDVATIALSSVSFTINKGEFVSIVGPSGSGKSTLLQILGLLDAPTSGKYRLDGIETNTLSDEEVAHLRNDKIGFIFQSFNLLARTSVLENVKLPLTYSDVPERKWDELAKDKINLVGLSHRLLHESNELSGGERQRVAIARALVNNPEIIFADEPTGNLDSKSGLLVMDTLEKLRQEGHTIILITHDRQLAKRAERAILVKDGCIDWIGDPKELPEY